MSAPPSARRHAETQADVRTNALMNRRTTFIRLNWNSIFQLFSRSLRNKAVCQEEGSRAVFSPRGFPFCRNEPALPSADTKHLTPAFFQRSRHLSLRLPAPLHTAVGAPDCCCVMFPSRAEPGKHVRAGLVGGEPHGVQWGSLLIAFPELRGHWDVPILVGTWTFLPSESLRGLFAVRLFTYLEPLSLRGGATLVVAGSHLLVEDPVHKNLRAFRDDSGSVSCCRKPGSAAIRRPCLSFLNGDNVDEPHHLWSSEMQGLIPEQRMRIGPNCEFEWVGA